MSTVEAFFFSPTLTDQQRELEKASPQICGADAEIWREFIKRDIPGWENKPHEPKNPKNWYRIYYKLRVESQAEVDKDAEILKAAMQGIKTERAKHTSKVIDARAAPKLPRMGGMRVEGGRSRTTTASGGNPSVLSFASGSRTKAVTGKSVLEKARREAREMSLFSARKTLLATPTHKLTDKASHVRSAPQGLVDEHKKPATPAYTSATPNIKSPTVFAPRKTSSISSAGASAFSSSVADTDRERRLKAFTTQSGAGGTEKDRAGSLAGSSTKLRPQNTSTFNAPADRAYAAPERGTTFPSTAYRVPRLKRMSTPDGKSNGLSENKRVASPAAADPLMRAKKRRIS